MAADNGMLVNEGQKAVTLQTRAGHRKTLHLLVATFHNILASVADVCDLGNVVKFHKKGGPITNLQTKEVIHFRRSCNDYVLVIWVDNPSYKSKPSDCNRPLAGK